MNTLIQALFNGVFELPDDVIGWVGGVGRATIGREVEGQTQQLFVAGGRFGPGAATAFLDKWGRGAALAAMGAFVRPASGCRSFGKVCKLANVGLRHSLGDA